MTPPYDRLNRFGWAPFFAAHFATRASGELVPARVAVQQKKRYLLYAEAGELRAEIAGRIHYHARAAQDYPVIGDWVAVRPRPDEGTATIVAVLPRRSHFSRKIPGTREEEQIVAANIDTVFFVNGLDTDLNLRRIERYLVLAAESGAIPVIVLNKADLVEDAETLRTRVHTLLPGVPVMLTSATHGAGLDELLSFLPAGTTGALLGPSGTGKSTLVNALLGTKHFHTDDVRASDNKGRHTTSHRELVVLPAGGLLIDTPGIREMQLWGGGEGVLETFEDIEELLTGCKFTNCRHEEEPGCAVRKAIDNGTLDPGRLENYHKMLREIAHQERRIDKAASQREKERQKRLTAQQKRGYRKS
jgi:ribosome biogenesis GTPase / thiamine phosphate phosphatase